MIVIEPSNGAAIFTMSRASFGQPVRRRYPERQITEHSAWQGGHPPPRQMIRRVVALAAATFAFRRIAVAGALDEAAFFECRPLDCRRFEGRARCPGADLDFVSGRRHAAWRPTRYSERCGRGRPLSRALSRIDGLRCADMRGKQ